MRRVCVHFQGCTSKVSAQVEVVPYSALIYTHTPYFDLFKPTEHSQKLVHHQVPPGEEGKY